MPIQRLHTQPKSEETPTPTATPRHRRWVLGWKIGAGVLALLFGIAGFLGYKLLAAVNTTQNGNSRVSVFTQLGHIVAKRDSLLRGEAADRVNILLLGIGGAGHDGPLLTDTMILASIKPSTGQVALISIPRDLAVDIPGYGVRKINSANALGTDSKYPGGGEALTADIVQRVAGLPVHYFIRVDFAGFEDIIKSLKGITVTVERSFTDTQYPNESYGYQTIRFTAGTQQMDGKTALTFARSRHGNNGEGSDFARSERQQLVLEGIRDKALSFGTLINPVKISSVLTSLGKHTRTDMEVWEMLRLTTTIKNASTHKVITRVLDSSPTGPLMNTTGIDGAFLLETRDAGYETLHLIVKNVFAEPSWSNELARIAIRDSAAKPGTARLLAARLVELGFTDATVFPASGTPATETKVIDQTSGKKPASVQELSALLGAPTETTTPTSATTGSQNVNASTHVDRTDAADILIVLGSQVPPLLQTGQSTVRQAL